MKIVVFKDNILNYEATIMDDDLVNGAELYVGRDDDCHIVLDSQMISRHHAIVKFEDEQLHIISQSSWGQIRVDGRECSEAVIQNGSKVEINEFVIQFDNFSYSTVSPDLEASELEPSINQPILAGEPIQEEQLEDLPENDDLLSTENFEDDEALGEEESGEELGSELGEETSPMEYENEESLDSDDEQLDNEEIDNNQFENQDTEAIDDSFDNEDSLDNDEVQDSFEEGDFAGDENFGEDDEFAGGDDFGGEDDFGGGGFGDEDEKTQFLTSFASFSLKIFGEYAPFDTFKLDDPVTNIGRDNEQCQIVLNDPEVSKIHAIIKKNIVSVTIEDNDSSNGIILNGERINKSELTAGDEFIIGETTFTVVISSDIIDSEKGRLMPVEEDQEIVIEDDTPVDMDFNEGEGELSFEDDLGEIQEEPKSLIEKFKRLDRKKQIIYGVVALVLLYVVFSETPEPQPTPKKEKEKKVVEKKVEPSKYSPEKLQELEANYNLAMSKFNEGQYYEAKTYIDIVLKIDPNYKLAASLSKSIQDSLDLIARKKEEEQAKKERLEKLKRINDLVEKAKEAVKEKRVEAARSYFSSIYELDPENIDVPPLKIEIDAYVAEKERKAQEEALAKARRKAMVDKLAPGKAEYLKGEWYKAVNLLQKFVADKDIDEDLLKKGTQMLKDAQRKLIEFIEPLLSKARSFREAQDLKMAYETYGEVLKYDPGNEEALNLRENIFTTLLKRSRKVYREGLIKEDLSDFANAKEKFQEVQQISPINSEYYNKATEKLKNYLE